MTEGGPNTPSDENDAVLGKALREAFAGITAAGKTPDLIGISVDPATGRVMIHLSKEEAVLLTVFYRHGFENIEGRDGSDTRPAIDAFLDEEGWDLPCKIGEMLSQGIASL